MKVYIRLNVHIGNSLCRERPMTEQSYTISLTAYSHRYGRLEPCRDKLDPEWYESGAVLQGFCSIAQVGQRKTMFLPWKSCLSEILLILSNPADFL